MSIIHCANGSTLAEPLTPNPSPRKTGARGGARFAFACIVSFAATVAVADELRLDAKALHESAVSTNLRLASDGAAIELQRTELYEDDGPAAGYSYLPNEEKLAGDVRVRKTLVVPRPQATRARLLVAPGGTLTATLNGKPCELVAAGTAGRVWQVYDVPPDRLVAGENEFVFAGTGKFWIARDDEYAAGSRTRTKHPNRSAKSLDGGRTWDDAHLGTKDDVDGEYYVRLVLDQHRERGTFVTPVIDAANLSNAPLSGPVDAIGPLRIELEGEFPATASATVRARTGSVFAPDEKHWSAWTALGPRGGTLEKPAGRYVQIAVDLATTDPLRSPRVTGLVVRANPTFDDDWTRRYQVVESNDAPLVRTSIPFDYEPFDHERLTTLRKRFALDDVVAGASTELELIRKLGAWTSQRWKPIGHLKEAYPPWDALEILKSHSDGTPVGGFCQQFSLTFLQACESFGLVGRAVSLGPGEGSVTTVRGGHEVVELWSNEFSKWIYVDGQAGWYFVDPETRAPLSLLELRDRQLPSLRGKPAKGVEFVRFAETTHEWKGLDAFPAFVELRLIPRSDFLKEKSPLPLNQGMRGWYWTGHFVWTDAEQPAAPLYGNRVERRGDWEWTVNRADVELEATATPGEFRVHLDSVTPGLKTFMARIDDGAPQPVKSGFAWTVHAGENRLEVRPRNVLDRDGAATRIVLRSR